MHNITMSDVSFVVYCLAALIYCGIRPTWVNIREGLLKIVFEAEKWYNYGNNKEKADRAVQLFYSSFPRIGKILPKKVLLWLIKNAVKRMKMYIGSTQENSTHFINLLSSVKEDTISTLSQKLIDTDYGGDTSIVHNDSIKQISEDMKNQIWVAAEAAINEQRQVSAKVSAVAKHTF